MGSSKVSFSDENQPHTNGRRGLRASQSNKNKIEAMKSNEDENVLIQNQTQTAKLKIIHPKRSKTRKGFKPRKEVVLEAPPSARDAAFGGPPRYDWIDIETHAAIKVQAAYRRHKVMNDVENQGMSTGAIRNRARRRHAEKSSSFFNFCGADLSFADFSSHDREAYREYQKMVYEEKKKARYHHEEELRTGYDKLQQTKHSEGFEIVP